VSVKKEWIVLHHSVSADGQTFDTKAIRNYHVNIKGYRDISYHYMVEEVGGNVEIIVGRNVTERGAHTKELDFNKTGIGVCVIGNFDIVEPGRKIMDRLVPFLRSLMEVHDIPAVKVIGHREAQQIGHTPDGERKTCPGRMFDMAKLREILAIP
jgi:N-acetylmuramoyl-L-alanine amidase